MEDNGTMKAVEDLVEGELIAAAGFWWVTAQIVPIKAKNTIAVVCVPCTVDSDYEFVFDETNKARMAITIPLGTKVKVS